MPRKVLFIVNPNAGKKLWKKIIRTIRREFPQNIYYQIVVWKNKDHFDEINSIVLSGDYTDVVAVGGDGTVNQVAKTLLYTNICLGIIPIGSGNGLARSLGLSMEITEVIKDIVRGETTLIDHGLANGIPFFCTSGVGFDAHIGSLFARSKSRGLKSYVKITLRELFRYRAKNYNLHLNGEVIRKKAFLITVANAGQYGNDFFIAPEAKLNDGLFHVVVLKPFNILNVSLILSKILRRKAHKSGSIETYTANNLRIERQFSDTIHFDGEPMHQESTVLYENKKQAIRVIVGDKFLKN